MTNTPKPSIPCQFCGSWDCWRQVTEEEWTKRFNRVGWLHSCPEGKALDMQCDLIEEAEYNVGVRTGRRLPREEQRPPEPPAPPFYPSSDFPPEDPGFGPGPFWPGWPF